MEEAEALLHKAMELGDAKEVKLQAIDDPDLKPLWKAVAKALFSD